MGLPFPLGLTSLQAQAPHQIPLAWGINGCASVIGAVLALLLVTHLGTTLVLLGATLLYLSTLISFPRPTG